MYSQGLFSVWPELCTHTWTPPVRSTKLTNVIHCVAWSLTNNELIPRDKCTLQQSQQKLHPLGTPHAIYSPHFCVVLEQAQRTQTEDSLSSVSDWFKLISFSLRAKWDTPLSHRTPLSVHLHPFSLSPSTSPNLFTLLCLFLLPLFTLTSASAPPSTGVSGGKAGPDVWPAGAQTDLISCSCICETD